VRAPASSRFVERTRVRLKGVREPDGGCGFLREVTLKKGQRRAEREVEYDPTTCDFIVAEGEYRGGADGYDTFSTERHFGRGRTDQVSASSSDVSTTSSSRSVGTWSTAGAANQDLSAAAAYGTCPGTVGDIAHAYQVLWYEDPPGLDVTKSDLDLAFQYNYVCVNAGRSYHTAQWLSGTGWRLTAYGHDAYFSGSSQSYAEAVAYTGFTNSVFGNVVPGCSNTETYTNFKPNQIRGFKDGYVTFIYYATKSGSCKDLLTFMITQGVV
jgi:hypothetical protein